MTGEPPLECAVLRPGMESAFNALLRILAASIPAGERKSESALRAMLRNPAWTFLIARASGTLAGVSICAHLSADAALLEYMAVDPAFRRARIGTRLFAHTAARALTQSRVLLIEVDSLTPQASDRETLARRIAFYRQLGCRPIGSLAYRMPQVAETEPPPMNLFLFSEEIPAAIDKPRLQHWLESIYTTVYNRSPHDPNIAAMLSTQPDPIPLPTEPNIR